MVGDAGPCHSVRRKTVSHARRWAVSLSVASLPRRMKDSSRSALLHPSVLIFLPTTPASSEKLISFV
jgi:hypothetical protein